MRWAYLLVGAWIGGCQVFSGGIDLFVDPEASGGSAPGGNGAEGGGGDGGSGAQGGGGDGGQGGDLVGLCDQEGAAVMNARVPFDPPNPQEVAAVEHLDDGRVVAAINYSGNLGFPPSLFESVDVTTLIVLFDAAGNPISLSGNELLGATVDMKRMGDAIYAVTLPEEGNDFGYVARAEPEPITNFRGTTTLVRNFGCSGCNYRARAIGVASNGDAYVAFGNVLTEQTFFYDSSNGQAGMTGDGAFVARFPVLGPPYVYIKLEGSTDVADLIVEGDRIHVSGTHDTSLAITTQDVGGINVLANLSVVVDGTSFVASIELPGTGVGSWVTTFDSTVPTSVDAMTIDDDGHRIVAVTAGSALTYRIDNGMRTSVPLVGQAATNSAAHVLRIEDPGTASGGTLTLEGDVRPTDLTLVPGCDQIYLAGTYDSVVTLPQPPALTSFAFIGRVDTSTWTALDIIPLAVAADPALPVSVSARADGSLTASITSVQTGMISVGPSRITPVAPPDALFVELQSE